MTTTKNAFDDKFYPARDIDPSKTGTHQMKQRPRNGWLNTCDPVRKDNGGGRKIRRARRRLAERMKIFEDSKGKNRESNHVHQSPGSLKCR